jgi:1-acyl-sn-glycerol-3-phosphate acyltransferase
MIRNNFKEYINYVDDCYVTKKSQKMRFPTPFFYFRLISIILRCSIKAKNNQFTEEIFHLESYNVFKLLEDVGVEFEITGISNVKNCQEPVVFVGNHMSTLETFILPLLLIPYTPISFVVKESLIEYPVFGHIMKAVDPITVTRKNPREDLKKVLEDGTKKISEGRSIIVFPQTTRKIYFNPSEFNTIGVKLAKRANVPIIPIALKTDAWQNGNIIKDFGPIDNSKKVFFSFGELIKIKGKGDNEHQQVIGFISKKLELWNKKSE